MGYSLTTVSFVDLFLSHLNALKYFEILNFQYDLNLFNGDSALTNNYLTFVSYFIYVIYIFKEF